MSRDAGTRRANGCRDLRGIALNEARGSISQQLVATIGLLEASLPASPKVGLELGEDRDIRSGKAVNRLPIVSDGTDLGEWFLMLARIDQVEIGRASCRERVCKYV